MKAIYSYRTIVTVAFTLLALCTSAVAHANEISRISVVPAKRAYTEGDEVSFRVTGKDTRGTVLTAEKGFHVQAYLSKRSADTSSAVGFNAQYDTKYDEWVVSFEAPAKGSYKIELILYCSQPSAGCSEDTEQKSVFKSFSVKRGVSPSAARALTTVQEGHVTRDLASDQNPRIVELADGTLEVYFNSNTLTGNGIYKTTSKDGVTWTKPKAVTDSWSNLDVFVDKKTTFLFQNTVQDFEHGLEIVTNGKKSYSVLPTVINDSVGSILKAADGYYYLSYSSNNPTDVYITKTRNFKTWSKAQRISSGRRDGYGSSLTQTSDGTFYIAYNTLDSRYNRSIEVASSDDGRTWEVEEVITDPTFGGVTVNMISAGKTPVMYWDAHSATYFSKKTSWGWSEPQFVLSGTPLGSDVIRASDGSILFVYVTEENSQRDIKIKNLGKIVD